MPTKYRVKRGTHIQGGRSYTKGQIVESDSDLSKLFKGKFERVHAEAPPVVEEKDDFDDEKEPAETVPAAPAKSTKAKTKTKPKVDDD